MFIGDASDFVYQEVLFAGEALNSIEEISLRLIVSSERQKTFVFAFISEVLVLMEKACAFIEEVGLHLGFPTNSRGGDIVSINKVCMCLDFPNNSRTELAPDRPSRQRPLIVASSFVRRRSLPMLESEVVSASQIFSANEVVSHHGVSLEALPLFRSQLQAFMGNDFSEKSKAGAGEIYRF